MTAKELITQIKDYADIADASYAMLHWVKENEKQGWLDDIKTPPLWLYADEIKQGYEITKDNTIDLTDKNNRKISKPTAYALAIEARFNKDKIVGKESILCFPFTELCVLKDKTIDNDITNVELTDKLSDRTIKFVNRYELLEHETNQGKFFR